MSHLALPFRRSPPFHAKDDPISQRLLQRMEWLRKTHMHVPLLRCFKDYATVLAAQDPSVVSGGAFALASGHDMLFQNLPGKDLLPNLLEYLSDSSQKQLHDQLQPALEPSPVKALTDDEPSTPNVIDELVARQVVNRRGSGTAKSDLEVPIFAPALQVRAMRDCVRHDICHQLCRNKCTYVCGRACTLAQIASVLACTMINRLSKLETIVSIFRCVCLQPCGHPWLTEDGVFHGFDFDPGGTVSRDEVSP